MNSRVSCLTKAPTNQSVSYTLPITCQICLSRVKEPTVCPNLHVFCSTCIDIWLEKTRQCPTCRIQIDAQNQCKRILGGNDSLDDADLIKPTEFSHPSSRKARYLGLFQEYEDEIERLNKLIDSQNDEIRKLRETSSGCFVQPLGENEIVLKNRLEVALKSVDEITKERDELKEENKKLNSENSILIQDISRLKVTLNEKNSQITSKYTMAALESKIEGYEKEIKQLQKALEKSDKYITDLEVRLNLKNKENTEATSHFDSQATSAAALFSTKLPLDFKDVDLSLNSKCNVIPKTNFYGSPSKTPNKTQESQRASSLGISSFNDKLKKNLFNTTTTTARDGLNFNFETSSSQVSFMSHEKPVVQSGHNSLLFSPMKRLRLEENNFEQN